MKLKRMIRQIVFMWIITMSSIFGITYATEYEGVTWNQAAELITITNGSKTIIMMDKNLGATTVGFGSSAPTSSYGFYYQWGGFTGFAYQNGLTLTAMADKFIEQGFILGTDNYGLLPGWPENAGLVQGPCPNGYHVPTQQEWDDVRGIFNSDDDFIEAIKIPYASYPSSAGAKLSNVGSIMALRSSTSTAAKAYFLKKEGSVARSNVARTNGASVRCFLNSNSNSSGLALTYISLVITEGELSIGISNNENVVTLSGLTASFVSSTITQNLAQEFRVEDLKGSSNGYYTTISVSDMVGQVSDGTSYSIPADNIYMQSTGNIYRLGVDNPEVVRNTALSTFVSTKTPVTFIERPAGTTAGRLGKYGDTPTIKVEVPANLPATTYKGVITYTLYEH